MYEPPDPLLLNRGTSREYAQAVLEEPLAFLSDVVNYGTNLIPKALGKGDDDMSRLVVCGGLLKHIVSMFDAAVVLLESGHSTTAMTQVRSAYEATLYLELILQEQTEYRARIYMVGEYRRRLLFIQRALDPSTASGSFNADYAQVGMSTEKLSAADKSTGEEYINHIQRVLSQPAMAVINALYHKRRGSRTFDPPWYGLLGHRSIRHLARALGQGPSYDIWYDGGSQVIHAQALTHQWSVQGDVAALKSIRHLEDAHRVKDGIAQVAIRAYRLITHRYLPSQVAALQEKYLTDWREHLFSNIVVRYEYTDLPVQSEQVGNSE